MKIKYNLDYVKAFYCNLELTSTGLKSRFKNKVIKFDYSDFVKYFGLKYEGSNVSNSKESKYEKVSFVFPFPTFFCEHIEMLKLRTSQNKFDIQLLYWIVVKILDRKLANSRRVGDNDLFLM